MPFIASRVLILVGTLQGGLLWWLWSASQHHYWPATAPMGFGALLWAVLAMPLAIYLSEGCQLSRLRRGALVGGVGIAYALMGAYAGWMGLPPAGLAELTPHPAPEVGFAQLVAALAMGFVSIPLVAAWQPLARRWNYQQLFEQAWRNALLCVSVAVLTGLFWAVLWAGAMLMNSLGLRFIIDLLSEPIFYFPVTGMVVGTIFAQGHARAELLVNLRRFWLSLNAWLLPLLLVFSVMWVVALPFTGLAPLFKTREAAFILLWFAVLAVKFINAAWQDGHERLVYPTWLATLVRWAWPTLVLVVGVAGWALSLRIRQYGWTEDRIWAVFIWLLTGGYAVGYSVSWLPRCRDRGWMAAVGASNIAVALIALIGLVLLMSPLADPRRLAVQDQVARLQAHKIPAAEFDYTYLRFNAGRWGLQALQAMSTAKGDASVADIASRARQALAQKERFSDEAISQDALSNPEALARLRVLPTGATLDTALLDYMRKPSADWRARQCLRPDERCTVWLHDLNGDRRPEALLMYAGAADWSRTLLMAQQPAGWQAVAEFEGKLPVASWLTAIEQQQVQTAPPEWPDLLVAGKRIRVSVLQGR